jgi:hypothetical protein
VRAKSRGPDVYVCVRPRGEEQMARERELEIGEATREQAMPQMPLATRMRRGWCRTYRSGRPPVSGQRCRCHSPPGRGANGVGN